jgi:hypothetical protein
LEALATTTRDLAAANPPDQVALQSKELIKTMLAEVGQLSLKPKKLGLVLPQSSRSS